MKSSSLLLAGARIDGSGGRTPCHPTECRRIQKINGPVPRQGQMPPCGAPRASVLGKTPEFWAFFERHVTASRRPGDAPVHSILHRMHSRYAVSGMT
jgi:hypothetical protein